jgi:hypothetical protein
MGCWAALLFLSRIPQKLVERKGHLMYTAVVEQEKSHTISVELGDYIEKIHIKRVCGVLYGITL